MNVDNTREIRKRKNKKDNDIDKYDSSISQSTILHCNTSNFFGNVLLSVGCAVAGTLLFNVLKNKNVPVQTISIPNKGIKGHKGHKGPKGRNKRGLRGFQGNQGREGFQGSIGNIIGSGGQGSNSSNSLTVAQAGQDTQVKVGVNPTYIAGGAFGAASPAGGVGGAFSIIGAPSPQASAFSGTTGGNGGFDGLT